MPETDWTAQFAKLAQLARALHENPALHDIFQEADAANYERVLEVAASPFLRWMPFGKVGEQVYGPYQGGLPCQAGLLLDTAHQKWGSAGNRAGKSLCGLAEDLADVLGVDPITKRPRKKFRKSDEGVYVWCVSDTEETSVNILQRTLVRDLLGNDQNGIMWNLVTDESHYTQAGGFRDNFCGFTNGSWLQFKYSTQKRNTFQGVNLHKVHQDEVQPQDIYSECMARLTDFYGYFLGTMTPIFEESKGIPWIFDKIYQRRMELGIPFYHWSMLDNPHISQDAKDAYLLLLDEDERAARVDGLFVPVGVRLAFGSTLLRKLRASVQAPRIGDFLYNDEGNPVFVG